MLIPCPICGARDLREFTPKGAALTVQRPEEGASTEAWNDYLHLRDNPAGDSRELWWHGGGCGAWLVVERNTLTHEVSGAHLAEEEAAR